MKKVLVTDAVNPLLLDGLRNMGFELDVQPTITLEQVREILPAYYGIIINSNIIMDRQSLDRAENLHFIGRLGSGMEIVDKEYAAAKGLHALNSPEGNRNAVAEHAMAMLLCLTNNIVGANAQVKAGQWNREENRGEELSGRTVGLIGYGNNGKAMARTLSGFNVKVLAYDKYLHNYSDEYASEASVKQIQAEADILSLHTPLTDETRGMVNADFIKGFAKPFYFINVARGPEMVTTDVIAALREGKIKGAALDVLENEKIKQLSETEQKVFDELVSFGNVILSPHIAGWTHESKRKIAEILLEKIAEIL